MATAGAGAGVDRRSHFEQEWDRIDAAVAGLAATAASARSVEQTTAWLYRRYQRASLAGALDQFDPVAEAIDEAIGRHGCWPDICLLKANLDFKFHRLQAARRDLEMAPGLAQTHAGRLLTADIHLQEGRYEDARLGYESAIQEDRTWDALARLAHWKEKFGHEAEAEHLYVEAEEEITAKDMRSYAWVELQRGLLDLRRGRHAAAAEHYRRAGAAYTGYWLVDEHLAELAAAEGRIAEAIERYLYVVARASRPELHQAIGELYVVLGDAWAADRWLKSALAGYLEATGRGGVHYYHHLVDFYCDARSDAAEAVKWAREDLRLRPNYATQAALAEALSQTGEHSQALTAIDAALASGVQDSHLFQQAAKVYAAAGRGQRANELSTQALAINPRCAAFHQHH